uniref:Uncharacterized protein n=1 Tax=Oryza rufipogon TaxID=4529 RepID=A0A0E0N290_ORYRU
MDDPSFCNFELRLLGMRGDDEDDLEEERVEVFGNTASPRINGSQPEKKTEPDDDAVAGKAPEDTERDRDDSLHKTNRECVQNTHDDDDDGEQCGERQSNVRAPSQ